MKNLEEKGGGDERSTSQEGRGERKPLLEVKTRRVGGHYQCRSK